MRLNPRFLAQGAIVALAYLAIASSLDDTSRLIIVAALVAVSFVIERSARR